jgi:hypothetical protein
MASDKNGVVIQINGDTKDVEEAFKKLGSLFNKAQKDTKSFSDTAKIAVGSFIGSLASQAVTAAFSAITQGFKDLVAASISAGSESEAAINKLNFALANTGKYSKQSSEDMQEFAEQLQKTSTVSDEAVLKNAALIQSLGNLDTQGLKRATAAALDLSVAIGIDFDAASGLLGKAAQGNVEALRRYGVQVEDTGNKTADFARALDLIEAKFGGNALNATKTFEGALEQTKISMGDVPEAIGTIITSTPAFVAAIKGMGDVFILLKEAIESNEGSIRSFIENGVSTFIDGIGLVGQSIAGVIDLNQSFDNFIAAMIDGFYAVAQTFVEFARTATETKMKVQEFFGASVEGSEKTVEAYDAQLARLENLRQGNALANAEEQEATAQKVASIEAFTVRAQELIQERIEAQRVANETEKEQFLIDQNERALQLQMASDQELEFKRLFNEQLFQDTVSIQGRVAAEEFKAQTQKLANEGKYVEALRKLRAQQEANEKNSIFAVAKYEELTQKQKLANLQSTLGQISQLQNSASKEAFAIGKAASIADATIKGFQAVQVALSSAPPPFNFALAALVGAATAANVAKIAAVKPPESQGFAEGGLVVGGTVGKDSVPIFAQQDELIAPPKSFDEVVEGTARQRGFVQGDENAEVVTLLGQILDAMTSQPQTTTVNIQGDILQDETFINVLGEKLNEAVRYRNLDLSGANA